MQRVESVGNFAGDIKRKEKKLKIQTAAMERNEGCLAVGWSRQGTEKDGGGVRKEKKRK